MKRKRLRVRNFYNEHRAIKKEKDVQTNKYNI